MVAAMKLSRLFPFYLSAYATAQVTYQNSSQTILRTDPGAYGPEVEEFHYYYDQWPIGLAVSSTGRLFVCYTRGNYTFTLGEAVNKTAEVPYPSADLNLPVSQLNTSFNGINFGSSNSSGLVSVQALYITPETGSRPETLWVVDTGRPTITDGEGIPSMPYGQPGGPKIIGISLSNNSIYATYTFPADVHYPDSYMNDVRFDLRSNVTSGGQGVAYIVDSSDEGRPGFIILDLGTGESWRRLTQDVSTLRVDRDVPSYQGRPFYQRTKGMPITTLREGLDGIQISPDGKTIYYSPLTSDFLYSIPAANLLERNTNPLAEQEAKNNVTNLGQRGGNANGFEGDSNGLIYQLMPEHNAIYYYDPKDLQTKGFVRDPRIIWPDSASIGTDGYFYMNINQLPYQPMWNNGSDLRVHPGAVLRAKLFGNGTKITSLC
jgi:sugar lactone lactonase YvrE